MKTKRFVVASDNHGDMADASVCNALFSFIADYKPDVIVHAGDNWDFRNLRRGATDDEKAASLADDWEAGSEFLARYLSTGSERYFLRGNHDERLWQFSNSSTGLLRDYARDGIKKVDNLMRKCRAKMLPYDSAKGVLDLGALRVIHGYHAGVGAARAHANVYRNCLFGHVHTIESSPVAALEPAEARSIGCLCRRDMDYIASKTGKLRWAQGWAYGLLLDNGRSYQLWQARSINGTVYAATDVKSYQ